MHKAMMAWEAGLKRLKMAELCKLLIAKGYVCFGQRGWGIAMAVDKGRVKIRIPEGRDGLYGGTEFVLALVLGGGNSRRLADAPGFAEPYKKILQCAEELDLLVPGEGAPNWPVDMPHGC